MAVNCYNKLILATTPIMVLSPNIEYSGQVLNAFDADFYRYNMVYSESMTYNLQIFPMTSDPIDVRLQLYMVSGEELLLVGTSYIAEFYNTIIYEGIPNQYRFCLTSNAPINYKLTVHFTDYPYVLMPSFVCYGGERLGSLDFAPQVQDCTAPIIYELMNGTLPNGLFFHPEGVINGTPTELDPQTTKDTAPSFTFHRALDGYGVGARVATSYDFPITIRASFLYDSSVYVDRDFVICIRNNWDLDKAVFDQSYPNFRQDVYARSLPKGSSLYVAPDEDPLCEVCPTPESAPLQLPPEEIEQLCNSCLILDEYASAFESLNSDDCSACPQDEQTVHTFEKIEPVCKVCEVEDVSPEFIKVEEICCPIEVVEVDDEYAAPEFLLDTPNNFADDYVMRLETEKAIDSRPVLNDLGPIYPKAEEDTTKETIGGDLCNECSN